MDKLLPCPFCGEEAKIENNNRTIYDAETLGVVDVEYDESICIWVRCEECDAFVGGFETEDEATTAWNRRSQQENRPLTLDELRGMGGEPVWVEFDGEEFEGNQIFPPQAHWCFVQAGGNQVDIYPCDIHEASDWSYYDTTFAPGGGARAYREKPKEDK